MYISSTIRSERIVYLIWQRYHLQCYKMSLWLYLDGKLCRLWSYLCIKKKASLVSQYRCDICVYFHIVLLFFFGCLFCLFVCLFTCVCVCMSVTRSRLQFCKSFRWLQGIHANVFNNVRANREHFRPYSVDMEEKKGKKPRKYTNSTASHCLQSCSFSRKWASYMLYVHVLWLTLCECVCVCFFFFFLLHVYKLWTKSLVRDEKSRVKKETCWWKKMRKKHNRMKNQQTIVWQTGKQKEMC